MADTVDSDTARRRHGTDRLRRRRQVDSNGQPREQRRKSVEILEVRVNCSNTFKIGGIFQIFIYVGSLSLYLLSLLFIIIYLVMHENNYFSKYNTIYKYFTYK